MKIGEDGPAPVSLADHANGRKVVIFAVPGAFTPTCHSAHMPSFIRVRDDLKAKGVDTVICVTVNDPWVADAWDKATGAAEADITVLADADGSFTRAIGMNFDADAVGFVGRSRRYAMLVDNGVVARVDVEDSPGTCDVSGGEAMLAAL